MKHKYFEIYIRTVEDTLQLGFFLFESARTLTKLFSETTWLDAENFRFIKHRQKIVPIYSVNKMKIDYCLVMTYLI